MKDIIKTQDNVNVSFVNPDVQNITDGKNKIKTSESLLAPINLFILSSLMNNSIARAFINPRLIEVRIELDKDAL